MIYAAIYWLAIKAYAVVLHIAAWFNPKAKLFVEGRKHLLQQMQQALLQERRPRIWMHCASLGEFEQGRPVLDQLRAKYPTHALILTFFSPSGYEVRKNYNKVDYVFYLPMDGCKNAVRFLNTIQPSLCIFVKYELWYYYLRTIRERSIKTILISATFRKDQLFFKWYGSLQRTMLRCFTHIFVQDQASVQLLADIGIQHVTVSGDTRFDRVLEITQHQVALPIAASFGHDHKIIIAGSTWHSDEVLLYEVLKQLPSHWRLILAPHEINDAHISNIEKLFEKNTTRWSLWQGQVDKQVLIVDNIGYLSQLYRYADVCWIGGGLDTGGVHNVLEAAVYGKPCAYGPVYHKYIEAVELITTGGAVAINNAQQLVQQIIAWEQDNILYQQTATASKQYVMSNAGATARIMKYISYRDPLVI